MTEAQEKAWSKFCDENFSLLVELLGHSEAVQKVFLAGWRARKVAEYSE